MMDKTRKRLLAHVTKDEGGCWICDLSKVGAGYSKIAFGGKTLRAHRLSYELFVGPIPVGMFILHSCDNPACVNPDHLHLGTQLENMRERSARGRAPVAEKNIQTKLTRSDAASIKAAIRSGTSDRVLARKHGVTRNAIRNIRVGLSWSYVD